jgi:signal peptidase I
MNKTNVKAFFLELILALGLAVVVYTLLHFTVQHSIVDGSSMLPGLENNQRLIINKTAYLIKDPQRGDVVIIHPPVEPQKQWVKRIVGMPGDSVRVEKGQVYVNGVALLEPYIREAPAYIMATVTVPAGQYFVMGDNRNHSSDSHYGWTVARENIIGEVWLRFWPFNQWGLIHSYPLAAELQAAGAQ